LIAATKARWTRGTFIHTGIGKDPIPCYRWKNVLLFKQEYLASCWMVFHAPTMLGLGARWSRLRDAKAAVEAMDAEFGLDLLDEHESWDTETRHTIRDTIRRLREFA
jgi:hypothetical protein